MNISIRNVDILTCPFVTEFLSKQEFTKEFVDFIGLKISRIIKERRMIRMYLILIKNIQNSEDMTVLINLIISVGKMLIPAIPTALVAWLGYKYAEKNTMIQINEARKDRKEEDTQIQREKKYLAYREALKHLFRVINDQHHSYIDYSMNTPNDIETDRDAHEKYILNGISLTLIDNFNEAIFDVLSLVDKNNNYELIIGYDIASLTSLIDKCNKSFREFVRGNISLSDYSSVFKQDGTEIKDIRISLENSLNGFIHRPEEKDTEEVLVRVKIADARMKHYIN